MLKDGAVVCIDPGVNIFNHISICSVSILHVLLCIFIRIGQMKKNYFYLKFITGIYFYFVLIFLYLFPEHIGKETIMICLHFVYSPRKRMMFFSVS